MGIDTLRTKQRNNEPVSLEGNETVGDTDPPIDTLQLKEETELLVREVARLPDADRKLITGFYHDGMSCHELSEATGLSYINVKVRLHRARKKLRQEME